MDLVLMLTAFRKSIIVLILFGTTQTIFAHWTLVEPTKRTIEKNIVTMGTVSSKESQAIQMKEDGTVLKIFVKQGDIVQKGDVIATVDNTAVKKRLADVDGEISKYQNGLEAARQRIKKEEKKKKLLIERFKKGYVSKVQIEELEGAIKRQKLHLRRRELNFPRLEQRKDLIVKKLVSDNFVSEINGVIVGIYSKIDSLPPFYLKAEELIAAIESRTDFVVTGQILDHHLKYYDDLKSVQAYFRHRKKNYECEHFGILFDDQFKRIRFHHPFECGFNDMDEPFYFGALVEIKAPPIVHEVAMALPWNAVKLSPKPHVFLANDVERRVPTFIDLGVRGDYYVEVKSGLTEKDKVWAEIW